MRLFRPHPRVAAAVPGEAAALAALYARAWAGLRGFVPERVVADQSPAAEEVAAWFRGGFEVYTAAVDGALAGVIRCSLPTGAAVIDRLAVDPSFRRRGVGRGLVDHAVAQARRQGAARVWLYLHPALRDAISLHRAAGFRETARVTIPRGGGDVVLMEMAL